MSAALRTLVKGRNGVRAASSTIDSLFNLTPEHRSLREMVRSFTVKEVEPQAKIFNREEKFNMPLFRKLGDLGLLGITADTQYGGSGMDASAACVVHEELAHADPAFTMSYLAHSMLFVNNVNVNASHEQKKKYLPAVCSGEKIAGMCMSEPGSGTDVLAMRTLARRDGDSYVLNGSKMWITNGGINETETGDLFLVYAKTGPVDDNRNISMFLVEKGTPGFRLGYYIKDKCGMRASGTGELVFENCRVPAANLVGKEGSAVKCMMRNLEIERVTLSAISTGLALRCIDVMKKYSFDRKCFGHPIADFGQIQRYVALSYAQCMSARCYMYNTANHIRLTDAGHRLDTDGVKLICSAMGKEVADNAIQVLGGNGYIGDYVVERLWRDAKLLEIGGGTLESHHKNMMREFAMGHDH